MRYSLSTECRRIGEVSHHAQVEPAIPSAIYEYDFFVSYGRQRRGDAGDVFDWHDIATPTVSRSLSVLGLAG